MAVDVTLASVLRLPNRTRTFGTCSIRSVAGVTTEPTLLRVIAAVLALILLASEVFTALEAAGFTVVALALVTVDFATGF